MTATTLGQTIRQRRMELGLTQEQLAERIGQGVRQAEVSRLECDRVTLPRRERLERIAAALELEVGQLLASAGWFGATTAFGEPTVSDAVLPPLQMDTLADRVTTVDADDRLREAIERAERSVAEARRLMSTLSLA